MHVHRDWLLTAERAAIHLPTSTAVLADLHLGYAEVRCRAGDALPATGLDEVVAGLRALLHKHDVKRIVIAGDLCEDARAFAERVDFLVWLEKEGVELAGVVPGNHDRGLAELPLYPEGFMLGDWRVVHGHGRRVPGRIIQGHVHPCLRWAHVTAPCYLIGADQMILPAFSCDAAGVDILRGQDWNVYRCCAIAGAEVLDFGRVGELRNAIGIG